jgi:flagellar protein FlaI
MTELGTAKPSDELRQAAAKRPHLRNHLKKFKQITGEFPLFIDEADSEYETNYPNVLYPVGGPIYCHIYGDVGRDMKYYAIEQTLTG